MIGLQEVLPATLADLPYLLGSLASLPGPDRGPSMLPMARLRSAMRRMRGDRAPQRGGHAPVSAEHQPIGWRADRLRPIESGAFWISTKPDHPASRLRFAHAPFLVHWGRFDRIDRGGSLLVLNAHLGHAPWHHGPTARVLTDRIRSLAAARHAGDRPDVFLIGDFNALPSSALVRALTSESGVGLVHAARAAPRQSGPPVTFHWGRGVRRFGATLDYVLARTSLRPAHSERIEMRNGNLHASDHHLLVVGFE